MSIDLKAAFEKFEDVFLAFDEIENKRSARPDLHAFLLLEELVPARRDIVSAAEHDQIWLDIPTDELSEVITEKQVEELVRCGVMFDEYESLSMFV